MDLMQKRDEMIELHEKYLKLFDELTNEVQRLSESKPELQTSDAAILRALAIVNATEWSGDIRVNMNTIIGAGRVLAKALAVTETNLCTEQTRRANISQQAENFKREWHLRGLDIEHLTARLAEAEAERDLESSDRVAAEFEMLVLRDRLSESEAEIKRLNQVLNNSLAGIEDAYSGGSEQAAKGGE